MADRRLLGYGLLINVFFLLTVRDLLVQTKSDNSESEEKNLPPPKMMQMRSTGPSLKFLYWYVQYLGVALGLFSAKLTLAASGIEIFCVCNLMRKAFPNRSPSMM